MFRNIFDPKRQQYLKTYETKSLGELEKLRLTFTRGIEDHEREIKLLKAQIAGLMKQRPSGFGAKVEELEANRNKRQTAVDMYRDQLAAIKQLIARKSLWPRK